MLVYLLLLLYITLQRKHVCNMTHVCKINIKHKCFNSFTHKKRMIENNAKPDHPRQTLIYQYLAMSLCLSWGVVADS